MAQTVRDFRQTWLWKHAFINPRSDSQPDEQEFFRVRYLDLRAKAEMLVSRIAVDLPSYTLHDISHLDALWDTASLVAEGAVTLYPVEAFVLGSSFLLHDAGMSLAAFPGGMKDVRKTTEWRDAFARYALLSEEAGSPVASDDLPEVVTSVLPDVLRRLHARHAETIAEQPWLTDKGEQIFLIDDPDLRQFYGPTIGRIAHSHWWPVAKIAEEFSGDLGAFAPRTRDPVDTAKLSCLLRIADALHLDSRRAPRFLRTVIRPKGYSALHWKFQERLSRPHIEGDAVVFTVGQPFPPSEVEAWWLAYETLESVDWELRQVDSYLQTRGRELLRVRRVKGAGSPELLSRTIQTRDWRPVDAKIRASDVPKIIENLGGAKLYGDDPRVAIRELIQNSADAIQARRRLERRPRSWGEIVVNLQERDEGFWLSIEDNGTGMSEQVLTGPLIDFGTSFWRTSTASEEFPGLQAAGMRAVGRFGIGFFSVFMLGSIVRVYSRRYDREQASGRLLEFREGIASRPILTPTRHEELPLDGGTRVEVLLKHKPHEGDGILSGREPTDLQRDIPALIGGIAPTLDVALCAPTTSGENAAVSVPNDWLTMPGADLVARLVPFRQFDQKVLKIANLIIRALDKIDGEVLGRGFVYPERSIFSWGDYGLVTVGGLKACPIRNLAGVFLGSSLTASRNTAVPLAPGGITSRWATDQAKLIAMHVPDEEFQAKAAEVVLNLGGDVQNSKVVSIGNDWFSVSELEYFLQSESELYVCFDGEPDYDEDVDDVHPREFRQDFELSETILVTSGFKCDFGLNGWPSSGQTFAGSAQTLIAGLIRQTIADAWGEGFVEDEVEVTVGTVNGTAIRRSVTTFWRSTP